jgi:hypothetical protein
LHKFDVVALAVIVLTVAVAWSGSGCSRAEAAPLEVTYYYLPG